jgi:hypothetical protein
LSQTPPPPTTFQALSARLRRVQFVLGLGFAAAVAGALISAALFTRVRPVMESLGPGVGSLLIGTLVSRLWVLMILPVLGYGVARVLELKPWRTALGAAVTGEVFYLALDLVTAGFDGLLAQGPMLLLRALTLSLGVVLARRAILRGRADAARSEEKAKRIAEENRVRYAEYLVESERVATLREASAASTASGTAATAPTSATTPATPAAPDAAAPDASAPPEKAAGS